MNKEKHPPTPDHQLLRKFEREFSNSGCSAFDFIRNSSDDISISLQIEIVAVAVEMALRAGEPPNVEWYQDKFSHLGDELNSTLSETIEQFVELHCPFTSAIGPLPKEVDGYLIEKEIGRGGMGVVYQARQLAVDRTAALKVLFFSRETILAEARALASLQHPNICKVYDTGIIAGLPFMAMKHVVGPRLTDFIKSQTVPLKTCVDIASKLCLALQEAHDLGVIHMDIKPSNIILTESLEPILSDFGLASRSSNSPRTKQHGSPSFLAPEQLTGATIHNRKRCDIYSLGTVLYEMLTGRRAFHGTVENIIDQVLNDPPRRPTDYRAEIPATLEQTCLKAMSKQSNLRFHSMLEFHNSLQQCELPTD